MSTVRKDGRVHHVWVKTYPKRLAAHPPEERSFWRLPRFLQASLARRFLEKLYPQKPRISVLQRQFIHEILLQRSCFGQHAGIEAMKTQLVLYQA